jgi:dethiobiotin synthase
VRVVILGTGTNVGKTYVTACLAEALRSTCRVLALKPVETGVGPHEMGDAGVIATAAGHDPLLSPWRFPRPVSPHLVAREAGIEIVPAEVAAWVAAAEQRWQPQVTLIESAGGALSPLSPSATNTDLAAGLGPALWLLVAPDALGVLHDVRATLAALSRRPDALLLSSARPADESTGSNAVELERLGIARVLAHFTANQRGAGAVASWLLASPSFTSS